MPNQDLRFRRRVQTVGEQQPKSKFTIVLAIATAAIIVPALIYTLVHPASVSSKVKQIVYHMPAQVKDIGRIAVVAQRSTPTPQPTPTPTKAASATPAPKSPAQLAHLAHLKRVHALALAAAKKLASIGQASDVSPSTASAIKNTAATSSGTADVSSSATATPAAVAELPAASQPTVDATPVYAPQIVVDARFTREVHPDYPDVAKAQGVQGTAIVLATIGPNGNVLAAKIDQSTGNRLLDNAALQAARASGFEPPKINGQPATETYRLVYTFSL